MISQGTIKERSRIYNQEIRRLGFQKTHLPRSKEKEDAMVESAVNFLRTFFWEKGSDGILRVKYRQK